MGIKLEDSINRIIKNKISFLPVFWIDKEGTFYDILKEIKFDSNIDFNIINTTSKIEIQKAIRKSKSDKKTVFYLINDLDVDSYIASGKANIIEIDINDFLTNNDELYNKVRNKLYLSNEQFKLVIYNFENVYNMMLKEDYVDENIIKNILLKVSFGKAENHKDLIIKVLKNDFQVEMLRDANLMDNLINAFKNYLDVSVDNNFIETNNLIQKVLLSLAKNELKDDFPSIFEDMVINMHSISLSKLFEFIKENKYSFKNEIYALNEYILNNIDVIDTEKISYSIPVFFEMTIENKLKKNSLVKIELSKLWTEDMQIIGEYFKTYETLEALLNQNINYFFIDTTMKSYIKAYKEDLYLIDNLYRKLSLYFESLSTISLRLYNTIFDMSMFNNISDKYYNVILNINSKYINNYNFLIKNTDGAFRQRDVFKNIRIKDRTVVLLADGLRYEMAKELVAGLNFEEVSEYDVFSEIPSETEVCMNSYFITDENIRISDKCTFELTKDNKIITQLKNWRINKAKQILNKEVIDFEMFKNAKDFNGIVLCFNDTIDNYIHKFKNASKVSSGIEDIKLIIEYSINRKFDVLLLSDHGFIEAEEKIREQDNSIALEKKKGRYLILNEKSKCDTSFYLDSYKCADFIDTNGYKICFINSINTLKKVGKYTHGGISLQENIIPVFLIKCRRDLEEINKFNPIQNISCVNEIKANLVGASGYMLEIYHKGIQVYKIEIQSDNYNINYPIRDAVNGDEFLIVILKNNMEVYREVIKKQGRTMIDKDLDIFGGR
jgi:hypothetical protein